MTKFEPYEYEDDPKPHYDGPGLFWLFVIAPLSALMRGAIVCVVFRVVLYAADFYRQAH